MAQPDGGRRGGPLAALLLPASLLPVLLLAPSLARAPVTLWLHLERMVAPAHVQPHHEPSSLARYPIGAARLEVEAFAPAAGVLTPQVGVSPIAEHAGAIQGAYVPVVVIASGREVLPARRPGAHVK